MKNSKSRKQAPLIHGNIIETWRWVLKRADVEECFPPELNMQERWIFTLGLIAGREEQKGTWKIPEHMKLNDGGKRK